MKNDDGILILTRYLYSKVEVKQSLLLSLFDHQYNESLFWAYELYFSGFQDECFEYIANIYEKIYSIENPHLRDCIQKIWDDWNANEQEHWHLGTIVASLVYRNYRIGNFMEKYFGVKCIDQQNQKIRPKLFIHLKEKDIEPYKTVAPDLPRNYLKMGCKYQIRTETNNLFKTYTITPRVNYVNNWLYYCIYTPFWIEKIMACSGVANEIKKEVEFRDDNFESFYDVWGIEPDEQPADIINKLSGNKDTFQLSIMDFCKKYNATVITKKIKMQCINAFNKLKTRIS